MNETHHLRCSWPHLLVAPMAGSWATITAAAGIIDNAQREALKLIADNPDEADVLASDDWLLLKKRWLDAGFPLAAFVRVQRLLESRTPGTQDVFSRAGRMQFARCSLLNKQLGVTVVDDEFETLGRPLTAVLQELAADAPPGAPLDVRLEYQYFSKLDPFFHLEDRWRLVSLARNQIFGTEANEMALTKLLHIIDKNNGALVLYGNPIASVSGAPWIGRLLHAHPRLFLRLLWVEPRQLSTFGWSAMLGISAAEADKLRIHYLVLGDDIGAFPRPSLAATASCRSCDHDVEP